MAMKRAHDTGSGEGKPRRDFMVWAASGLGLLVFSRFFKPLPALAQERKTEKIDRVVKSDAEWRRILTPIVPGIEVLGLGDVPPYDEPAETEPTFEGNALLKAQAALKATGLPSIADDTGLFVDALGGEPGVRSARYAGEGARYEDDVVKLLDALSAVRSPARSARFRTVIAVVDPEESFCVEGELEGEIIEEPRGTGGFGYDPVFVPHGSERTLAEMSEGEKNRLSHRARALAALAEELARRERFHEGFHP